MMEMANKEMQNGQEEFSIQPEVRNEIIKEESVLPVLDSENNLPAVENKEEHIGELMVETFPEIHEEIHEEEKLEDDRSKDEIKADEEREDDLYDIRNFSL